jgi:hypothetical protein
MNVPPFFQGNNYLKEEAKNWPMPILDKLLFRIQGVKFPEGMFIFAVPKAVVDGTYKYSSNIDGNVFAKHNIQEVQFTFGGHSFFLDTISIGKIQEGIIENKLFYD